MSVTWQQHAQSENARAIAESAGELYTRIAKFTEHLEKIRTGLERANQFFNDAVGSYDRMVRPAGERLQRLQGDLSGRQLADLQPLPSVLAPSPEAGL